MIKKVFLFAIAFCTAAAAMAAIGDTVQYTACQGDQITLQEWTGRYQSGYTFKWYKNTTQITGATHDSYTTTSLEDTCTYKLVVLAAGTPIDTQCFHITVKTRTTGTATKTACDSYTWINGETYTASTSTPTVTLRNAAGCDSIVTLNLTVNHGTHNNETHEACDSYTWHNVTYTTGGDKTYSYTANGCPSSDTLHLTIKHGTHNSETHEACDTYTWHETAYTTGGDKTHSYTNAQGCPSVDTLHLTIKAATTGTTTQTACDSYTWINGETYTTSTTTPTVTLRNVAGCDSILTLNLTIYHGTYSSENREACDSYIWHDVTYTASGDKTYRYTNSQNCPSVDTLHLTIVKSSHSVQSVAECGSYTWNGSSYTTSGKYINTYQEGICANSDTLYLTIYDAERPAVKTLIEKKHPGSTTPWMLIYPRTEGDAECSYQWYKDSVLIPGATKQYYQLPKESAGTQAEYSVWVSDARMLQCGNESKTIVTFGKADKGGLHVWPNPSNGHFSIILDTDEPAPEGTIYTTAGTKVKTVATDGQQQTLPTGTYLLRVETASGSVYTERIVVR